MVYYRYFKPFIYMLSIMKKYILSIIVLTVLSVFQAGAQEKKATIETVSFRVSGVCEKCQARIENAARIKGVKTVSWDKEKQLLQVVFVRAKTDQMTIEREIAKAGHDTEHVQATDEAYNNLHDCCKYRHMEVH